MGLSEKKGRYHIFGGPSNKDPTIKGTMLGSPIFGNPHMKYTMQSCRFVRYVDKKKRRKTCDHRRYGCQKPSPRPSKTSRRPPRHRGTAAPSSSQDPEPVLRDDSVGRRAARLSFASSPLSECALSTESDSLSLQHCCLHQLPHRFAVRLSQPPAPVQWRKILGKES